MKHFLHFKHIALTCGLAAAAALVSSCTEFSAPTTRAEQLVTGANATVFSYNDTASPKNRLCTEAGPMPVQVTRALNQWLRNSTIKSFSYAYPQYYIAMTTPTGSQRVWALCSDGQGNLVGVLIPRDGVAAWDLPYVGSYKMYVCETKDRTALSDSIMEALADAGYDTYRIDTRKASGLTQKEHLISKPLTAAEKARIAELKRMEEEARKAAAEKLAAEKSAAAEAAAGVESTGDASAEEEATDEEGSDEESTDEEVTEEEGSDEEATEEESTEEEGGEDEEISEEDSF